MRRVAEAGSLQGSGHGIHAARREADRDDQTERHLWRAAAVLACVRAPCLALGRPRSHGRRHPGRRLRAPADLIHPRRQRHGQDDELDGHSHAVSGWDRQQAGYRCQALGRKEQGDETGDGGQSWNHGVLGGIHGPGEQLDHAFERDRDREHADQESRCVDVLGVEGAAAQHDPDCEPAQQQQAQGGCGRKDRNRRQSRTEDLPESASIAQVGCGCKGREGRDGELGADHEFGHGLELAGVAEVGDGPGLQGRRESREEEHDHRRLERLAQHLREHQHGELPQALCPQVDARPGPETGTQDADQADDQIGHRPGHRPNRGTIDAESVAQQKCAADDAA